MRTVKRQTLDINNKKMEALEKLCRAYAQEKSYWLNVLRNWEFQSLLGTPRKIRDRFVDEKYQSKYGLQARHWKLALQDAIETWDKYWQALFVQVRTRISKHPFTNEERHYAYWLLKGYLQFAELMQGKDPLPNFNIEKTACHHVASYVRRIIRKLKKNVPTVKKRRIVKFDANCYDTYEHNGRQYLKLMSLERGRRLIIPLKGMTKIEGTLTIVLGKENLDLHISQDLKPKKIKGDLIEAVDFGYSEVMTDTQGLRYGKRFGEELTKASDNRHKKMQKRHKLHALVQKSKKAARYRKYNLGRKKLNATTRKTKSTLEREINTGINQLIITKNPAIVVTEDLSHTFTYNKSKSVNRKLSSWLRGKLQERVEFKALAEGFRHEQVNPAYGSQTCPHCDLVDHRNRKGDKFKCLYCGHEDISDRIAALNYAKRIADDEIGLYMPYSQVKAILMSRFQRRLETGEPVTVPGRTLETVAEYYPRDSVETKLCYSR